MPAPYFYLREDERVLLRLRAQPSYALVLFARPAVLLSVLLVLVLVARSLLPPLRVVPGWAPWAAWASLLGVVAFAAWRRAATSEYALTNDRIYARVGRLVTRVHLTTHDKVTDIGYRQGPLERALGIASLTFATAGGEVRVSGVRDALALKSASEAARDAFIRELLAHAPEPEVGDAGAPEAPSPRPAPAPRVEAPPWTGPRPSYLQEGETPVWYAQPRPIAAVGALRSLLGVLPIIIFAGAFDPARRALLLTAALGLVLVYLGVKLTQLRRTEYTATDRRVYGRHGLVGTTVNQLTYDKITDITYQQDLLGRVFGYGTVVVQTAGGSQAPIAMVGLADPLGAKATIERWRDETTGAPR